MSKKDQIEGISREHVGDFLGLGCHGEDEEVLGESFERLEREGLDCERIREGAITFCREKKKLEC